MEPPHILHPLITGEMSDLMLVQQASRASPAHALDLRNAASTTLGLIATAEKDRDNSLGYFASDAAVFISAIWRSYLGSRSPQLWPSRELRDIITAVTLILDSAKKLVAGGMRMRTSKFQLVRRIKIARDAPRIKLYRTQLSICVRMAQAEILKLNPEDMQTTTVASAEYSQSRQFVESNSTIANEGGIGERMAPETSARPNDDQFNRAFEMGAQEHAHTSDNDTPQAAPEGIFDDAFSRPRLVINMMFVSGSAVAIGGGDAHVHTRT
ncbi:hypothetical protein HYPSUDRAFT_219586 [Hypholoma sublateritium FD-334 SS-4]|uniref:Uncharacterized protein n=1 Tax=Hypholoma sublateritium (strain FD-334 SS-4) TaxID=945553 RepID=A0A0D2LZ47_HYPSF|nr:hypothetical protein HYPSUDRAFT_219586 [Hypholoma sublateritium FD-334 SS-4]